MEEMWSPFVEEERDEEIDECVGALGCLYSNDGAVINGAINLLLENDV